MGQSVAAFVSHVDRIAPPEFAYAWDRIGLHLGSRQQTVERLVVALDLDDATVAEALNGAPSLIVVHHPPIWEPLSRLNRDLPTVRRLLELDQHGHAVYAAHTNWDAAEGGVSDTLASIVGLTDVEHFGRGAPQEDLVIVTYVPESDSHSVIDALTDAGAGVIGNYDRCAFLGQGTGTFRPMAGANPTIGEVGAIESVSEIRVEMTVSAARLGMAIAALRMAHPYEEPAYHLIPLHPKSGPALGRVGDWNGGSLPDFILHVEKEVGNPPWIYGEFSGPIERVAVAGGAGLNDVEAAIASGAQVFLTGEAKHSDALSARDEGIVVMLAGHGPTEFPGMVAMAKRLAEALPETDVTAVPPQA
ncbi:MAG: Nif3-like dinuclear metal center hexameric protein [Fimbriimonadaceae bacterium]|nr:Nif3-like dinuclear metal center hexameric protein [Fimbriimonadaceae bacterium]